jgi:DNA-binding phage protein
VDSVFWEDLARDMTDPEFARAYVTESVRIAAVDAVIGELDRERISAGLSKAALARAVGAEPAVIRRLFSAGGANPTLGTLAGVAAALGLRVTLEPLPAPERGLVTAALRSGQATAATARLATDLRAPRRRRPLPRVSHESGE